MEMNNADDKEQTADNIASVSAIDCNIGDLLGSISAGCAKYARVSPHYRPRSRRGDLFHLTLKCRYFTLESIPHFQSGHDILFRHLDPYLFPDLPVIEDYSL